jgi:hypothetical protein
MLCVHMDWSMCTSPCGNEYGVHSRSSCVCLSVRLSDSEVQIRHTVYPQWVSVLNDVSPPGGTVQSDAYSSVQHECFIVCTREGSEYFVITCACVYVCKIL